MTAEIRPTPAPVRALVTGAAGFIGSHLVDKLCRSGAKVVAVDNLDPWYGASTKRARLGRLASGPTPATAIIGDLGQLDLVELFATTDVVFHLAGRPGVQDSWGQGFSDTCMLNVALAQRVLEAATAAGVGRVVLASSSSVYGNEPFDGRRLIAPISPYGVSKAAAEQLGAVYGGRGLEVTTLRYFTVFGPRQRPDMAMSRLFAACLGGPAFRRRGTGDQRRQFTYVGDVVAATVAAGMAPAAQAAGRTFDIGGGCSTSLNEVIHAVAALIGARPNVVDEARCHGDPASTTADIGAAQELLNWRPQTSLDEGLARQWAWHRQQAHGDSATTELGSLAAEGVAAG